MEWEVGVSTCIVYIGSQGLWGRLCTHCYIYHRILNIVPCIHNSLYIGCITAYIGWIKNSPYCIIHGTIFDILY